MCKVSPPCPRLASGLAAVLERGHSPLPSTGLAFSVAGKEEGEAMAGCPESPRPVNVCGYLSWLRQLS